MSFYILKIFVFFSIIINLQAQWLQTDNGIFSGKIYSIATNSNYIFAGTDKGLFITDNYGANWKTINSDFDPNSSVSSILIDGKKIYIGTRTTDYWSGKAAVYLSTDNGSNWNKIFQGIGDANFISVQSLMKSNGEIFVGTDGGVFASSDEGNTWNIKNNGLKGDTNIVTLYVKDNLAFVKSFNFYKSSDYGQNWKNADRGLTSFVSQFCFSNNKIIAGTSEGIYISSDNGINWEDFNSGLTSLNINALAIKDDFIFAACGYSGLYVSTNLGNNWNISLPDIGVNSICIDSNNNILLATEEGVYLSTDSGSIWKNIGLTEYTIEKILSDKNKIVVSTNADSLFLTTDYGLKWSSIYGNLPEFTNINSIDYISDNIYIGTSLGLYRTENNGLDWKIIAFPDTSIDVKISGNNIFAKTWENIYYSNDFGINWINITKNNFLENSIIGINDNNIYIRSNNITYLTTNFGEEWKNLNQSLTNINVQVLASNENYIFAGTILQGIYRSSDGGDYWFNSSNGFDMNDTINCIAIVGNNTFIGSQKGVYISTDNGDNWNISNIGLTNNIIYSLHYNGSDIIAGTGDGIFISTNNGTNWTKPENKNFSNSSFRVITKGEKIFTASSNKIMFSEDDGNTWEKVFDDGAFCFTENNNDILAFSNANGLIITTDNGANWRISSGIYSYGALGAKGNNIFTGGYHCISLSSDYGINWSECVYSCGACSINAFAFRNDEIFACVANDAGIVHSTDNGNTWSVFYDNYIQPLSIFIKDDNIFAGTWGSGLYFSSDNGVTWHSKNTGLPDTLELRINVITEKENYLFLGTDKGVFISNDFGEHWTESSTGLTNKSIINLSFTDTYLFAGTELGLFKAKLNDFGINSVANKLNVISSDIFPNPAGEFLNISLKSINSNGNLIVYSLQGMKIMEAHLNGQIDISSLNPGIYFAVYKDDSVMQKRVFIKE